MATLLEDAPFLASDLDFVLPRELEANEPPEVRGRSRDHVRLLVASGDGSVLHARFTDLPAQLRPGDLIVVNTSATLPAAVDATLADGSRVELHYSTRLPADLHLVELRRVADRATTPFLDDLAGQRVELPGGAHVTLLSRYRDGRLWVATLHLPDGGDVVTWLRQHGRAIRYAHVDRDWPISAYQNTYATEPGSAEMPSAGRPFTPELITALVARGIDVAPLVLHTGVSSLESHEPPYPEWYRVPPDTARRVNQARAAGTTVVRALESAADASGQIHPAEGWTELVVTPQSGLRAVDGLLTGMHEPRASHLLMLEAVLPRPVLANAYDAALRQGYLWHEFGDVMLLVP
jgi:S-adenosylmethionine:tRNA ribosyltransferase-isomerase